MKTKQIVPLLSLIILASVALIFACSKEPDMKEATLIKPPVQEQQIESKAETQKTIKVEPKVKSIIFMIGDGMGVNQVSQAIMYRQMRQTMAPELNLEKLTKGANGLMTTYTFDDIVTDSASAATAMACGQKVLSEVMGITPDGYPCETILEKAAKLGKGTGLVSTTRLTHATPGAFASHQVSRHMENDIAIDHIEKHNIDVFLDGGMQFLTPQYKDPATKTAFKMSDLPECAGIDASIDGSSKREDQKNLVDVAKQKGYKFACTNQQLSQINTSEANLKVLGVFSNSVFPMIQERRQIATIPPLATMTDKALEILDKKPEGFFLMVEGGLIDYAGHDNDPGAMLQETLDFDAAIGVAMEYVQKHPDTLLVVTADHETGGFGFSYAKQEKVETILPSSLVHSEKYNFAPHERYDLLMKQQKSFRAMVQPITKKLYPEKDKGAPIAMVDAVKMLKEDLTKNSVYQLTDEDIKTALTRKPNAKDFETCDFKDFYVYDPLHADAIGRAVAKQTSTVWATGTHTAAPVMVFAFGPEKYANLVEGLIDNTDIGKIMEAAFLGKDYVPSLPKIKGMMTETESNPQTQPTLH